VTVELNATDNLCGVKEIKYKINDGSWQTYSEFTVSDKGTTTVYYYSEDHAGNIEKEKSQEIKIDKTLPSVSLTSPNGNEEWKVGTSHDIIWTAEDTTSGVASIKLEYSTDSGNTWMLIADGEENDRTYSWIIPNEPSENCRVRVTAYDNAGNYDSDSSNNDFTIPPKILGDVSGNGEVTAYDAALVLQHLRGLITLKADQVKRADVDGETGLTANDAKLILKRVVGLIPKFPVE